MDTIEMDNADKPWNRQKLNSLVRAFLVCYLVSFLPLGIWKATGDLQIACITTAMNAVMLALGYYFRGKNTGDSNGTTK